MTQIFRKTEHDAPEPTTGDSSTLGQPASQASQSTNVTTITTTVTDPSSSTLYPVFLLFGDSITQLAATTLQSSLQELYIRRLDILNRGYGGYTSLMGLDSLPHFLPPNYPSPSQSLCIPHIKMVTIFFGANDACDPSFPQHVPIPTYVSTLRRIITYPVFKRHSTHIFLITPPPINEHQLPQPLTRTALAASRYASACRTLVSDLKSSGHQSIHLVDIWSEIMMIAGYDPSRPEILPGSLDQPASGALASMFIDGLHPSPQGYSNLYIVLMDVIRREAPDCLPENIPMVFRQWREALGLPQP